MEHSFDILVAREFGIVEAILIKNFQYWIIKNKANNKHFYEGHTWSYNSIQAFTEIFPYLSYNQIRYALNKLVDAKVLLKGNFNEKQYDRTLWYCFADEKKWLSDYEKSLRKQAENPICENSQMDLLNFTNGQKYSEDSDEYILASYLLKKIRERNPSFKQPNLQVWSKHVDYMLRIDKRDKKEVAKIIHWAQTHSFWQNNILSTAKLRDKYDQLKLQMDNSAGNGTKGRFNKEKYQRLLGEEDGSN